MSSLHPHHYQQTSDKNEICLNSNSLFKISLMLTLSHLRVFIMSMSRIYLNNPSDLHLHLNSSPMEKASLMTVKSRVKAFSDILYPPYTLRKKPLKIPPFQVEHWSVWQAILLFSESSLSSFAPEALLSQLDARLIVQHANTTLKTRPYLMWRSNKNPL